MLGDVKLSTLDPLAGKLTTAAGDTYTADLIVGADGLNSFVRGILAPNAHPVPTGLIAYITTAPASAIAEDPTLAFQNAPGVGGICVWEDGARRVMCYPCDRGDARYFQIVAYAPEDAWVDDFVRTGGAAIQGVPYARLLEDYADFPSSILALLRYVVVSSGMYSNIADGGGWVSHAPTVSVWRIRDIDALHSWVRGKTVLIGDAAHAVTPRKCCCSFVLFIAHGLSNADVGQGCNIAIEDAEALGFAFRDVSGPAAVAERLVLFEKLRMARAHHVQFSSRQLGGVLREDQKENVGEFDRAAFAQTMYGYKGAEAAYEAYQAAQK